VLHRSNSSGAFAALMLALALSGCANADVFDANERWFSRPFDWTGRSGGYSFSELQETKDRTRQADANDLVSPNGACPPAPMPAAAPPPTAAAGPGVMPVSADPSAPPTLLGGGVELGMTECQVVYRAGAPSSVQLGQNPNGDRTAVLTFDVGPRAGIYHFQGGRLTDMDRVATAPAPEPKAVKRVAKKKTEPTQSERVSTE
jgi:hypothetical protein